MQKDPKLGLGDKFFLDDAKNKDKEKDKDGKDKKQRNTPNSIHLVRRADYLTHLLKEHYEETKGVGSSASKADRERPAGPRAKASHDGTSASGSGKPIKAKRKATPTYSSSSDESQYDSMDEKVCKDDLRPVKRELKRLKLDTSDLSREAKLAHLKECLSAIGSRIELIAAQEKGSVARDRRRKHLWVWTTHFFPSQVHWTKLKTMCVSFVHLGSLAHVPPR